MLPKKPENEWLWLALAPALIGTCEAAQRLNRAWLEGTLPLRGVPHAIPETHEPVEIPASDAGHLWLHCPSSQLRRGSGRRWVADYRNVQVRKADVERLAREAEGNQTAQEADTRPYAPAASDAHEADTMPQAAAPDAQKAGKLTRAVAWWLRHCFPDGQPPGTSDKLLGEDVRKAAGKKLGNFSPTTLKRAKRVAWPPGQTGPDWAKPGQPPR